MTACLTEEKDELVLEGEKMSDVLVLTPVALTVCGMLLYKLGKDSARAYT